MQFTKLNVSEAATSLGVSKSWLDKKLLTEGAPNITSSVEEFSTTLTTFRYGRLGINAVTRPRYPPEVQ